MKKIAFTLLVLTLLLGCKNDFGCPKKSKMLFIENNAYNYNCGLYKIELVDENFNYVCGQLQNMEGPVLGMINHSRGIFTIKFNELRFSTYRQTITLAITYNHGNIFKMQNGLYYRNDGLAKFIIENLQIKDLDKEELGNCP